MEAAANYKRFVLRAILVSLVGAFALGLLASLPYSTSRLFHVEDRAAAAPPTPSFAVGDLGWPTPDYGSISSLAPYSRVFADCKGTRGVLAASCVTRILQSHSPFGEPTSEFVDVDYDASCELSRLVAGGAGHCMSRSAVAAAALLVLEVPARVVQIVPRNSSGHNVIEVWDPDLGWTLFDPVYDSVFVVEGRPISSIGLTSTSGDISYVGVDSPLQDPNTFRGATIQFPEPWLYTRVGPRCDVYPLRGCFAQIGPERWDLGPAQSVLQGAALLAAIGTLYNLARAGISWPRPFSNRSRESVPTTSPSTETSP